MRSVLSYVFLLEKNCTAPEIHWKIVEVYQPDVMSDNKVRQWCTFKGLTNVHDEEHTGRPTVMMDGLVEEMSATVC